MRRPHRKAQCVETALNRLWWVANQQVLEVRKPSGGFFVVPEVPFVYVSLWSEDKRLDHSVEKEVVLEMVLEQQVIRLVTEVDFSKAIRFGHGVEVFACSRDVHQRCAVVTKLVDDLEYDFVC